MKGLDYALLAARKAELEREKDGVAEEELEAFAEDLSKGKREKEKAKQKVEPPEEKLGNRVSPVIYGPTRNFEIKNPLPKLNHHFTVQINSPKESRSRGCSSLSGRTEEEKEEEEDKGRPGSYRR